MNEVKDNLWLKIIRKFYKIEGPIDEYTEKEINRIGNNTLIFSSAYIVISNVLLVIFYPRINGNLVQLLILLNMTIYVGGIEYYVSHAVEKARLNFITIEPNQFEEYEKKAKLTSLKFSIYYFIFFIILVGIMNIITFKKSFFDFNLSNILSPVAVSIGYYFGDRRKKIKLIKQNIARTVAMEEED
ncbi:hypothetical protein BG262_07060 [Floricoccus penangensis]|uniref:DUF3278 domain-containing protein n=1 Tax=Floricoccus penangensis TaxID=1859475 RepID=A0A9Q5NYM2_9LACT|nr:DUF3278 domain-containing protein [Floricoccus penangensis]OFI45751.1 hypothetical protein BG262_07060 [Floricoccus penangensis]